MKHPGITVGMIFLAVGCGAVQAAGTLVPPPGFMAPVQKSGETRSCARVPTPYTGELKFPSKYEGSGKSRDTLNPKSYAKYQEMTAPINDMEKEVSAMVESYLHSGDAATLSCTIEWLDTWARADAMEDKTDDHTGKSVRKWMLASLASAWVRLKFSPSRPLDSAPDKVKEIDGWLDKLGSQVHDDWRDLPLKKTNNHTYWAAWAAMADAVALNRRDLFDWAVDVYRTAARNQVDSDGFLPNELARDTRALAYHNYALEPLTMIATFAAANGVNLVGEGNNALGRVVTRVLAGVDDPSLFESRTGGKKQEMDDLREPERFAWLEPYCSLANCSGPVADRMAKLRPLKSHRMGGDLTALFSGAPKKQAGSS